MNNKSRFETLLDLAGRSSLVVPIVQVADIAEISQAWLEEYCPGNYTAADVLTMAEMINVRITEYNAE